MTDARHPERWLTDRRFLRLSDAAHRLYSTALLWSVANRTDGVLFDDDLPLLPCVDVSRTEELGAAGLWHHDAGLWVIQDYAATQTSRDDLETLEAERRRQRAKMARRRARQAVDNSEQPVDGAVDNSLLAVDNPVDNSPPGGSNGERPRDTPPVPSPVPSPGAVPVTPLGQEVLSSELQKPAPSLPSLASDPHVRAREAGYPQADPPTPRPRTAQTLVGEWLERCPERPPSRIVGQVAKELGNLLAEKIAYRHVRQGLVDWHHAAATGRGMHPATLASFVHAAQAANGRASPRENVDHLLADQPEALRDLFRSPP